MRDGKNLIRKCPVENPCEASSFEEAFHKNKARFAFELREAAQLYAEMKKDGDPHAESVNPVFWQGCQSANDRAYLIYSEEIKKVRERVAARLAEPSPLSSMNEGSKKGYDSVTGQWIAALKNDNPETIVWW